MLAHIPLQPGSSFVWRDTLSTFSDRLVGRLLFTVLLFSFTVGFATVTAKAADMTALEKENKQLVLEFMAAFEDRDMATTTRFLADDFRYQSSMTGKREYGVQHFSDWWWSMVNDAIKLEPEVIRIEVMGNTVLLENTFDYEDATDKVKFHGTRFFHIKDGKIREYQEYRYPK